MLPPCALLAPSTGTCSDSPSVPNPILPHPPPPVAASCEVVAFGLGGLTDMPALRNFSSEAGFGRRARAALGCCGVAQACTGQGIAWNAQKERAALARPFTCFFPRRPLPSFLAVCAALAVLLDYLLQVTAFVALLTLDSRRIEQGRYDCWPWSRCVCRAAGL